MWADRNEDCNSRAMVIEWALPIHVLAILSMLQFTSCVLAMDSQRLPIPAILEQDIGAIKSFLTAGGKAIINDCCYESERYGLCSALMVACENGKIEVVRLLLEEGAEVGLKSTQCI